MKKKALNFAALLMSFTLGVNAQTKVIGGDNIQFFRKNDQRGVNVFENSKEDTVKFNGVDMAIGGHFAAQFQGLNHSTDGIVADAATGKDIPLNLLSYGFNTPTANLTIDVQLADGVRMNLTSYMSARHHNEFWIKGGYLQIDKLSFLGTDIFDDVMNYFTLKVGHMEINYGDQHFRRTDNANALYNPFVGNYIMDAFTTEIGAELYFQTNGFLAMFGITNGEISGNVANRDVVSAAGTITQTSEQVRNQRKPSILGKIGYDGKLSDDIRIRLTGSVYSSLGYNRNTLFAGDRAGSRYYGVLSSASGTSDYTNGRYQPGINRFTAFAINPFVKFMGLEFFGTYEMIMQGEGDYGLTHFTKRNVSQLAGELIYRFFEKENVFLGVRYNTVFGDLGQRDANGLITSDINRLQVGAGWFITKNILLKGEYMTQKYNDFNTGYLKGGKFDGFVLEAVVGF